MCRAGKRENKIDTRKEREKRRERKAKEKEGRESERSRETKEREGERERRDKRERARVCGVFRHEPVRFMRAYRCVLLKRCITGSNSSADTSSFFYNRDKFSPATPSAFHSSLSISECRVHAGIRDRPAMGGLSILMHCCCCAFIRASLSFAAVVLPVQKGCRSTSRPSPVESPLHCTKGRAFWVVCSPLAFSLFCFPLSVWS